MVNQTAEELVKSVTNTQDQNMMQELKTLLEFFENSDQVEVMSKTLEDYLLAPIDLSSRKNKDDLWIRSAATLFNFLFIFLS